MLMEEGKMKITITGTPNEIRSLVEDVSLDITQLVRMMEQSTMLELGEGYDDEKIMEFFNSVSWETVYLMDVIAKTALPTQRNDKGIFLGIDDLSDYDIDEKSASSRVGGSRRVCTRLNIDDVLFIRKTKKNKVKRYYLREDVISVLNQFLETYQDDYLEFIEDEGLDNPQDSLEIIE